MAPIAVPPASLSKKADSSKLLNSKMLETDQRYLELLKKNLLNELYIENEARIAFLIYLIFGLAQVRNTEVIIREFVNIKKSRLFAEISELRRKGKRIAYWDHKGEEIGFLQNFAYLAHSMIGRPRMDNIHQCMNIIVDDNIPGDLIETGVWKGGATIFMRGYLAAHGIRDRTVWVADSFKGLPKPTLAQDAKWDLTQFAYLSVSLEEVKDLFSRYELLDEQVQFLPGWFKDTLPQAPIKNLALLRMDGDLYESTMDSLTNLYDKVSPGGFVIVDDYSLPMCMQAITNFRKKHRIKDKLIKIDQNSVYWRKAT